MFAIYVELSLQFYLFSFSADWKCSFLSLCHVICRPSQTVRKQTQEMQVYIENAGVTPSQSLVLIKRNSVQVFL